MSRTGTQTGKLKEGESIFGFLRFPWQQAHELLGRLGPVFLFRETGWHQALSCRPWSLCLAGCCCCHHATDTAVHGAEWRTAPCLVLATGQSGKHDIERKLHSSSFYTHPGACSRGLDSRSSYFLPHKTKSQFQTNAQFTKQERKTVDDKKTKQKQSIL